jgi:L-lactate dehydrogenase complex protein LldF
MSNPELLERYIAMARVAGTDVERVAEADLPVRLAAALPTAGPKIVALSASGWPPGLREQIVAQLASSGFEVTAVRKEEGGYSWDIDRLAAATVGIVWCEHFLADTGSLVLVSDPGMGGLATLLPEISLVLSPAQGCLGGLADYLQTAGGAPPSRITLATGPSRTGDIEATMTKGVHGPGKVVHFIVGA